MSLTPELCRAARAMLDWSPTKLATESRVPTSTVVDFERGRRIMSDRALENIQRALESAGIEFASQGQMGVMMSPLLKLTYDLLKIAQEPVDPEKIKPRARDCYELLTTMLKTAHNEGEVRFVLEDLSIELKRKAAEFRGTSNEVFNIVGEWARLDAQATT